MRNFVIACCVLALPAPLAAQQAAPPAPTSAAPAPSAPAPDADPPPETVQGRRNWLLAHLILDRNLGGEQVQTLEQKLANLSADQIDVLVRVYQQKHGAQAAAQQAELGLAQENLNQLKDYRQSLSDEVGSWRNYRQAQYVNFGLGGYYGGGGYGGLGYGGLGYGGLGYGGLGYGGLGYGGLGYGGLGYGGLGYGGLGYGGLGYGGLGYGGLGYGGLGYGGLGYGGLGYGGLGYGGLGYGGLGYGGLGIGVYPNIGAVPFYGGYSAFGGTTLGLGVGVY